MSENEQGQSAQTRPAARYHWQVSCANVFISKLPIDRAMFGAVIREQFPCLLFSAIEEDVRSVRG